MKQIVLWSVFFLIPVGRGLSQQRLDAGQCEAAFARLSHHAALQNFAVKTTEAPHYRRFVLQKKKSPGPPAPPPPTRPIGFASLGVNDGKGILFVSHTGQIFPSGFLPIECGRFPIDSPVRVYQESQLFIQLRDSDRLQGKCGICEFRHICGGSRARAFALTGNPLAEEPDCIYRPARTLVAQTS